MSRGKKAGRPPTWTKRQLIDGIRWRTRVGSPWRDIPPQYGSWQAEQASGRATQGSHRVRARPTNRRGSSGGRRSHSHHGTRRRRRTSLTTRSG
ncbi:transposase [Nocardia vinacea]|uniref:transposase n=1 Tax=Nocardia vinacea TaxID=96468 RepID=UPI0033FC640D